MVKKRVSFDLEENIKKQVKVLASVKGTTATKLYTNWILEGIEKEGINLDELLAE